MNNGSGRLKRLIEKVIQPKLHGFSNRFNGNLFNQLVDKCDGQQRLGFATTDTTGNQVKQRGFIELANGGAVGSF